MQHSTSFARGRRSESKVRRVSGACMACNSPLPLAVSSTATDCAWFVCFFFGRARIAVAAEEVTPLVEESPSFEEPSSPSPSSYSMVDDALPHPASSSISTEFLEAQMEAKRAVERYKALQRKKDEDSMSSFDV